MFMLDASNLCFWPLSVSRVWRQEAGAGAGETLRSQEHKCQPQVPEDVVTFTVLFVDTFTQLD